MCPVAPTFEMIKAKVEQGRKEFAGPLSAYMGPEADPRRIAAWAFACAEVLMTWAAEHASLEQREDLERRLGAALR